MKKYSWKAKSDDGAFEDDSKIKFDTKKEAYNNMRHHALVKMKWNTEWEDFSDMSKEDCIGYNVTFHQDYIIHTSYSGTYTYEIVEQTETTRKHNRTWEVIDSFTPREGYDWEVCRIYGVGAIWMNNVEGYIVLIEESNRILKSDI
jgi:hypothetical protein